MTRPSRLYRLAALALATVAVSTGGVWADGADEHAKDADTASVTVQAFSAIHEGDADRGQDGDFVLDGVQQSAALKQEADSSVDDVSSSKHAAEAMAAVGDEMGQFAAASNKAVDHVAKQHLALGEDADEDEDEDDEDEEDEDDDEDAADGGDEDEERYDPESENGGDADEAFLATGVNLGDSSLDEDEEHDDLDGAEPMPDEDSAVTENGV